MAPGLSKLKLTDFSGGINLRDAPSELADNESPDCMNIVMDERGGVVKRKGLLLYNAVQLNTSIIKNIFYSPLVQLLIGQSGTSIYSSTGDGTWSAIRKTFTTSALVGFCDFQSYVVCVHPVDGVWVSTNGTAWTQSAGGGNNMEAVRGDTCAAWQNKVWVGGDPTQKPRIWACNAGNPQLWTIASDYVDIRDKDMEQVTCVGAGQGMDDIGRAGLLVFKAESSYRINSANAVLGFTYTTLSTHLGAAGPLCSTAFGGLTAVVGTKGISVTDGVKDLELVSGKVDPLFSPTQLAYLYANRMTAGRYRQHLLFSLPLYGSTVNNLTLQYSPSQGWIVPHTFGVGDFAQWAKDDDKLYVSDTSAGWVYEAFKGGNDNGTAITSRYQTRWYEPRSSGLIRMRRIRATARGTFQLYVKGDYSEAQGTLCSVAITGSGMLWGTGVWGTGEYGTQPVEEYQDFYSLGTAKSVSFNLTETSSSTTTAPRLLEIGVAEEVGNFAMFGLALDYVGLGGA